MPTAESSSQERLPRFLGVFRLNRSFGALLRTLFPFLQIANALTDDQVNPDQSAYR
jgi:hypothetical protein